MRKGVRIASALQIAAWLAAHAAHLSSACAADDQSAAKISDATQRHIRHIESHLLPAVLVGGEPVRTTALTGAMREFAVPGVSIAFIHGGRVEWTEAVGATRLGGTQVDANTVFQAASISKPVTAMAVMRLVQSGRIRLDQDVNGYLKSWSLPDGSATAADRATIRRLLSHTGGTTVHGFDGYASGEPVPTLLQVLKGAAPANSPPVRVTAVPGTVWSYSGGGYLVIQQMLADLTQTPFAALMEDKILKPIGMHHSSFMQPVASALQPDAATPYDSKGEPIPGGAHTYPEQSAAGLWSTPSDLALFAINLQHSLAGKTDGLLSPATAREMLKPASKGCWALGFRVGGSTHPYFMHGGSNAGFRSLLVAFDSGDGIVIMTNGDSGAEIAGAILRTAAVEYGWPEFQPKRHQALRLPDGVLDRFVGRFSLGPDATVAVTRSGERLYIEIPGETPMEITPETQQSVFSRTSDLQASFRFGPDHHAAGISLYAGMSHGAACYDGDRIDSYLITQPEP